MNWILGLLFILVVIYLKSSYSRKKKLARIKKQFNNNWGKRKNEKYFNFYSIGQYFEKNTHKNKAYHIISEKTKVDLDIDELFKFIDRTSSKIGQQYLYFKLRTIQNIEELKKFSSFSDIFLNNKTLRLNCQILLSNLNSNESYDLEKLINDKPIEKSKIIYLVYALSTVSVLSILLTFFHPLFLLILIPVFFVNSVFHYRNKEDINYYINAVSQLNKTLIISKKLILYKEIEPYFTDFSFIKKISNINFKTKFIGFEKELSNEFAALLWITIELVKIQFNLEYIIFYSFIDSIIKEKKSIEEMYVFIGKIDTAISTASLKSSGIQLCKPNFVKEKRIIFKDIFHPLIENCVVNSLNLNEKSMLLTGSNMSGKTTFIRTVALNSILAQTFDICFAKEYSAPFFRVYSSIRLTDDLLDNTSYYLQEVLNIKELIDASVNSGPNLFVLDEIFKGTNTIERVSGGKAVLSYLNKGNHIVVVSTHDIELTELLKNEKYELYHFSENIEDEELFFDHKLKVGKLKTRNAIKILELYKYPDEIISDARETEQTNFI